MLYLTALNLLNLNLNLFIKSSLLSTGNVNLKSSHEHAQLCCHRSPLSNTANSTVDTHSSDVIIKHFSSSYRLLIVAWQRRLCNVRIKGHPLSLSIIRREQYVAEYEEFCLFDVYNKPVCINGMMKMKYELGIPGPYDHAIKLIL